MRDRDYFTTKMMKCFFTVALCLAFFASCGDPLGWPSYTIVYNANHGSGDMEDSVVRHGTSLNLRANAFARGGHSFGGWARSANGAAEFNDGQNVANLTTANGAVVTLYAVWIEHTFTITFVANGGSGTMPPQVVSTGGILNPNGFTPPPSQTFLGWARSTSGPVVLQDRGNVESLSVPNGGEVRLYARWGSGTFTVTFHANGGEGTAPTPVTVNAGLSMTLPG